MGGDLGGLVRTPVFVKPAIRGIGPAVIRGKGIRYIEQVLVMNESSAYVG